MTRTSNRKITDYQLPIPSPNLTLRRRVRSLKRNLPSLFSVLSSTMDFYRRPSRKSNDVNSILFSKLYSILSKFVCSNVENEYTVYGGHIINTFTNLILLYQQ